MGLDDPLYSNNRYDYVGDSAAPGWGVGSRQCTEMGKWLMEQTGQWLLQSSGLLDTTQDGSRTEWEVIADHKDRNVMTATHLQKGILYKEDQSEDAYSFGIRIDDRFSHPQDASICTSSMSEQELRNEVQIRLNNFPRPSLSWKEGLDLVESLAGTGTMGPHLSQVVPLEPHISNHSWVILAGAASLLSAFGTDILLSRAGDADPVFAPDATLQQVFQLYQFKSWERAVMRVGNSHFAAIGASQAQAM
jgi:hypothetical protein